MYNDRELLAKTLMAEAGNQGPLGMLAAGSVIMNRVRSGNYGQGLQGVILKPGAFSPWNSVTGFAGGEQGQDMARITPSEQAYRIADALLSGQYEDPTGNATHFYNPDISDPSWGIRGGNEWRRIGEHVFGRADDRAKGPSRVINVGSDAPKLVASDTMAALGKGGGAVTPDQIAQSAQAQSTGMQDEQRPRGLLGGLFGNPDTMANLALAFNSMRLNPDPNLGAVLTAQMKDRRESQRKKDELNKTIAFFEKAKRPELAELARISPTAALTAYSQSTKPGYKAMTGAQVNQMYPGANLPADKLFNVSPTGQITQVGGGGVTVDMSGGGYKDKYWEEDVKSLAKRVDAMKQGGAVAAENLQTLQVMRDLYEQSPSGAIMGRFAEIFPEATDASAIVNSLRVSLAPKLRVEGSGSTSDIEYEGMLQSLGSFRNSPQANKAIIDLMIAKTELNVRRAEIANQVRPGGLDPYEAANQIQQLENQLWNNNPLIQQVKELAGAAPMRVEKPNNGSAATVGKPTHRFNPETGQVEEF